MANGTNATLLQILDTFENISVNHNMIADFFVGTPDEITANTRTYPLLVVDVSPVSLYEAYKEFHFRLYLMDIEQKDASNRYEVQSDAIQTIADILIACRDVYDLRITWGKQIVPFDQATNDFCAGAYIDTIISVPSTYGMCDFPVRLQNSPAQFIDSDGAFFTDGNGDKLIIE